MLGWQFTDCRKLRRRCLDLVLGLFRVWFSGLEGLGSGRGARPRAATKNSRDCGCLNQPTELRQRRLKPRVQLAKLGPSSALCEREQKQHQKQAAVQVALT